MTNQRGDIIRASANCKMIAWSFNWDTSHARLGQETSSSIHSRTRTRFEGVADFDPKPRSGSYKCGYHSFLLRFCQRRHVSPVTQFAKSSYTPIIIYVRILFLMRTTILLKQSELEIISIGNSSKPY